MKSPVALFLLGLVMLVLQGAFARILSPPWFPDLAWLVVVAIGLRWPHWVSGALLAFLLGYAMDLLSGSLMGQHALMRLVSYLAAAVAARQLDLSGGLPVAILVLLMTIFYGVAAVSMLAFFVGAPGPDFGVLGSALAHGVVNLLAVGPVISLVERILARFSDEEVGRRAPMPIGFERSGLERRGLG